MITGGKHTKLRVGVLMGGKSEEREVSFNSGRTICDHLDSNKYEVIPIFQTYSGKLYILPWFFLHRGKISDFFDRLETQAQKISWDDLKNLIDFLYISVHGRFAEDGTLQGFLEILQIPYLGSKVFASALGMNKYVQKEYLKFNNIDVAKGIRLTVNQIKNLSSASILQELKKENLIFPLIIKPVHEGSSIGVSVVKSEENLIESIQKACSCDTHVDQDVLIEEKLEGTEFVCVCLQKENQEWFALPITEVIPEDKSSFYDYVQKYMPGRAQKITPARFDSIYHEKIKEICIKATKVFNFTTISRIDGFLTKDGRIVLIDPNTLTGMGPATFLFHQAAEIGMSHSQLINYLIETELKNYGILKNGINQIDIGKENMSVVKNRKRVAVLLGGNTNEKEISLESGRNICYKLAHDKYEIIPIFVNYNLELCRLNQRLLIQNSTKEINDLVTEDIKLKWSDLPNICDFVFIGLHGGVGENGCVQATLEMLGLPYNGSGVLTSSLCMDKFKTNQYLKSKGFDISNSILIDKKSWEEKNKELIKDLNFPLVLKPHDDGCSAFVQKAKNENELIEKINNYFNISGKNIIMLEEFIVGMELTVGAFGNNEITVLPPSKVLANKEILSLEEKFLPGAGENLTPAPLPESAIKFVQNVIGQVYKILGCKGYARIDCFYQDATISPTKKERLVILEPNTLPGMTPATCIFHQAAEIGLKPMEFIDKIVELGFENHKKKEISSNLDKINVAPIRI